MNEKASGESRTLYDFSEGLDQISVCSQSSRILD